MVHRLRRQWGTSKGTVSLGTQLRGVRSKTCQRAAAHRPPGTHHSPFISGLNSSSSALRLDRLLRLRWLTARCPTPTHLALHGREADAVSPAQLLLLKDEALGEVQSAVAKDAYRARRFVGVAGP